MATNFPTIVQQFLLDSGAVAANCLLDTFASGTETPQDTFSDAGGLSANTNPITLDSAGRCTLFGTAGAVYTFRLRSPLGATIWTRDNVAALPVASANQFVPIAGGVDMTDRFRLSANANEALNPVPLQQVNTLIAASAASLTTSLGGQVPVGAIMMWPLATPPTNWLILDGVAKSRTTYATLFALWGTTFGVGDGSTTFGIPSFPGRFPRGFDSSGTVDPSGATRTLGDTQDDAMQNLTGTFAVDDRSSLVAPTGIFGLEAGFVDAGSGGSGLGVRINVDASRQARTATEHRPKNVAVHFIVKYQ